MAEVIINLILLLIAFLMYKIMLIKLPNLTPPMFYFILIIINIEQTTKYLLISLCMVLNSYMVAGQ